MLLFPGFPNSREILKYSENKVFIYFYTGELLSNMRAKRYL